MMSACPQTEGCSHDAERGIPSPLAEALQGLSHDALRTSIYFRQPDGGVQVKEEPIDAYEFVDDPPLSASAENGMLGRSPRKRGRPKGSVNKPKSETLPRVKIKQEHEMVSSNGQEHAMMQVAPPLCIPPLHLVKQEEGASSGGQKKITDAFKVRKKRDRFDGIPESEIEKRLLPDHITDNLDILIIGINPGLFAAFKGHHYAGPGNHFWKCLYLSGLIPEPMTAMDDYKMLTFGIGFTNIVARTSRGSADLKRKEIKEGGEILLEKIKAIKPKIAVFNGKGIYEVFSQNKLECFGKQPKPIEGTNTVIYVMPSSSARCAQLPRAIDKVPYYLALKKLRDYMRGSVATLDDSEIVFSDVKLKKFENGVKVKEEAADDGFEGGMKIKEEVPAVKPTLTKEDNAGETPKKKRKRRKKSEIEQERIERQQQQQQQQGAQVCNNGTAAALHHGLAVADPTAPLHPLHTAAAATLHAQAAGAADGQLARLGPAEAEDTLRDLGLLDPAAFRKHEVLIRQQENPVLHAATSGTTWGDGGKVIPTDNEGASAGATWGEESKVVPTAAGGTWGNDVTAVPASATWGEEAKAVSAASATWGDDAKAATGTTWGEEGKHAAAAAEWDLHQDPIDKELQEMIDQHRVGEDARGGGVAAAAGSPLNPPAGGGGATATPLTPQHPVTPTEKMGEKPYDHHQQQHHQHHHQQQQQQQLGGGIKQESMWNDAAYGIPSAAAAATLACHQGVSPPAAAYGIHASSPTAQQQQQQAPVTPVVAPAPCHGSPATSTSHGYGGGGGAVTSHAPPGGTTDFLDLAYSSLPTIKTEPRSTFLGQYDEGATGGADATAGNYSGGNGSYPGGATTAAFTSQLAAAAAQRSVLASPFAASRGYAPPTYIDPPNPGAPYPSFLGAAAQKDYAGALSRPQGMIAPHQPAYTHSPAPFYLPQHPAASPLPAAAAAAAFAQHPYHHHHHAAAAAAAAAGYHHASTPHHPHSVYPSTYPPPPPPGMYGDGGAMTAGYYPAAQMPGMGSVRVKQEPGSYFGHCPY
ncbi:PREDICTED: uncharacterized protein LOC106812597 [Priapulus caudatus]|uniref:Uncharacterized protein LOC106812597 n=1 Tax=Priapulus caudatus TaxID=37621 RepID=A0ABM1EIH1_PRICU|nr:PREDICTED: uncharacterized protein LOC106812597 [Priapulus caudatus]